MLGKPWLVSELTGTNNSHSICGFLSYEECICWGLEAAARAGEEARDCLMCLACREPGPTHKTSRSVPASANFFLLYVALLLDWVSLGHKFCTSAGHSFVFEEKGHRDECPSCVIQASTQNRVILRRYHPPPALISKKGPIPTDSISVFFHPGREPECPRSTLFTGFTYIHCSEYALKELKLLLLDSPNPLSPWICPSLPFLKQKIRNFSLETILSSPNKWYFFLFLLYVIYQRSYLGIHIGILHMPYRHFPEYFFLS